MNFAEDLPAFFADFGDFATIGAAQVKGIFDADYLEAFNTVSGAAPSFLCASADVAAMARGDQITLNGITYTVQKPPQADGLGLTRLLLQKA